jgi:hypothetical protein
LHPNALVFQYSVLKLSEFVSPPLRAVDHLSHSNEATFKIAVVYILISRFIDKMQEDKRL